MIKQVVFKICFLNYLCINHCGAWPFRTLGRRVATSDASVPLNGFEYKNDSIHQLGN